MQEVFKKIIQNLKEQKSGLTDWLEDKAFEIGIEKAIEIVKQVATEYNDGWIPCSIVDHPEHCRECEVTMVDTHGYTREIAFYTDRWRRESDEAEIIVIAWKEPSEPYQPKGE